MSKKRENQKKMNKIIKSIDDRITYYSGGEEMKSISELTRDSHIVKVLESLKSEVSIILNQNKDE